MEYENSYRYFIKDAEHICSFSDRRIRLSIRQNGKTKEIDCALQDIRRLRLLRQGEVFSAVVEVDGDRKPFIVCDRQNHPESVMPYMHWLNELHARLENLDIDYRCGDSTGRILCGSLGFLVLLLPAYGYWMLGYFHISGTLIPTLVGLQLSYQAHRLGKSFRYDWCDPPAAFLPCEDRSEERSAVRSRE